MFRSPALQPAGGAFRGRFVNHADGLFFLHSYCSRIRKFKAAANRTHDYAFKLDQLPRGPTADGGLGQNGSGLPG